MIKFKQCYFDDPEFCVFDRVYTKPDAKRCAKIIKRVNERRANISLDVLVQPVQNYEDRIKIIDRETGSCNYFINYHELYGFLCGLWSGLGFDK